MSEKPVKAHDNKPLNVKGGGTHKSRVSELPVKNSKGAAVGKISVDAAWLPKRVNEGLIHEAVTQELLERRIGTSSTKTRGEVSGGGKKPWKQKGTGRARQGSIRSPQWRHGAVVFGPRPRPFDSRMPRQQRHVAFTHAFASCLHQNKVIIIDNIELEAPKTKHFMKLLENLDVLGTVLVVLHERNEAIFRSARNIQGVKCSPPSGLTSYEVLKYEKLVMTKPAFEQVQQRLLGKAR